MFQNVQLIGYVGNDPVLRSTPSGVTVTDFSLAINRQWTDKDGNRVENTIWVKIVCWREQAEVAARHITKGRLLLVVGDMLAPEAWIAPDGKAQARMVLTAQKLQFFPQNSGVSTSGSDERQVERQPERPQAQAAQATRQPQRAAVAVPAQPAVNGNGRAAVRTNAAATNGNATRRTQATARPAARTRSNNPTPPIVPIDELVDPSYDDNEPPF